MREEEEEDFLITLKNMNLSINIIFLQVQFNLIALCLFKFNQGKAG